MRWRMWRVRNAMALSTLSAGATFVAIGGASGAVVLAVFGAVMSVGAVTYHARPNHNYWVTCTLASFERASYLALDTIGMTDNRIS